MISNQELQSKSFALRQDVLDMIYRAKTGHIGGDLSVMDILVTLYYKIMNVSPDNFEDKNRDRFVMSKGHCVESLYAVLADVGFFPKEDLQTYATFGSDLIGHPTRAINGIEMNTGSLGHGLSVAVGMALAGKMDHAPYRVYTVMGDGELAEGSVWEAVMAASHYQLDHLMLIVDKNNLQISGTTQQVMTNNPLDDRFKSFGWNVLEAKGNDIDDLENKIHQAQQAKDKPSVIIANTTKGYGVSFIENQVGWHHKVPSEEQYIQASNELREEALR